MKPFDPSLVLMKPVNLFSYNVTQMLVRITFHPKMKTFCTEALWSGNHYCNSHFLLYYVKKKSSW